MRIAFITSQFPFGPKEAFLSAELHGLARYADEIVLVPTRPAGKRITQETFGMEVAALRPFSFHVIAGAAQELLAHPLRVARAFAAVAAGRGSLAAKCKNLALFPKGLAVARLVRSRRIDHIHAHWLSTPSTVGYVASSITGVPWSCTAHRFDLFADNMLAEKARTARFIRTISERARNVLVEKLAAKALEGRCHVVHLGVTFPERIGAHAGNGRLVIVCPASFVAVKGHRYLLEALAELRKRGVPFECHLAGEGPLRRAIERQIAALRIERSVVLRGVVDHDRLCAELANGVYDVAVLASTEEGHTFEGVPVALMEAMAAGVACVATKTGSIPELIFDDQCSYLVPQRDAAALADALERLYVSRERREAIAVAARARIAQAFDARRTSQQLYELMSAT